MNQPRSAEDIFANFVQRRSGLLQALTDDSDEFFDQCDPSSENLVAYGHADGTWSVALPAEEVPPELPEPCLGINFARDGMLKPDWLALVAVHSDAWLMSVAFYYGAKLDSNARLKLFRNINTMPTLYEIITGKTHLHGMNGRDHRQMKSTNSQSKRKRQEAADPDDMGEAQAADAPLPTGRLLTYTDITPTLKGRQAELYWPDDKMWYLIEVAAINIRTRIAKIQYTSGELEDLDLNEIIREGHMSLICQ